MEFLNRNTKSKISELKNMLRYCEAGYLYMEMFVNLHIMTLHPDEEISAKHKEILDNLTIAFEKGGMIYGTDNYFLSEDDFENYEWINETGIFFEKENESFTFFDTKVENGTILNLKYVLSKLSLHEVHWRLLDEDKNFEGSHAGKIVKLESKS